MKKQIEEKDQDSYQIFQLVIEYRRRRGGLLASFAIELFQNLPESHHQSIVTFTASSCFLPRARQGGGVL